MKILTIVKMKLQSKIKVSKNLKFLAIHIFLCLLSKSFAYQHRTLTDICLAANSLEKEFSTMFNTVHEVFLGEYYGLVALIQLSWNLSNFQQYDDCKFRVVAAIDIDVKSRNRSVFVSIRRLNLRKSPVSEDCVDYIQFTYGHGKTKSPKFCGQLNGSVDDVKKVNDVIYFGEDSGIIDVQIHLNALQPLHNESDTLDVELMFTVKENGRASSLIGEETKNKN